MKATIRRNSAVTWAKKALQDPITLLAMGLFLFQLLLVHYEFLLQLGDINLWDEAHYVNWGRLLSGGMLPPLSENPFTATFYMLTYLPFIKSPYWLAQSASLARLVLFCFLWLGSYLISRQMEEYFHPIVLLGFIFLTPTLTVILNNPSDAVFAAISAFALWQTLKYYRDQKGQHILLASLFLSFAALSRSDGIILYALFLSILILLPGTIKTKGRNLLLAAIPFTLLVGGYVVLRGAITGDYNTGIPQRSYVAFEQGHGLVFEGYDADEQTPNPVLNKLDFDETYGTEDENNSSVLRAILNNPPAYLARVKEIISRLPNQVLDAYHKKLAVLILLLALRGLIELIRKREFFLLAILLLWMAYLGVYLMTFIREGYLLTPYFIVYALGAAGITALVINLHSWKERSAWTLILLGLILYGIGESKLAIFYGAAVFLVAMWLVHFIQQRYASLPGIRSIALILFFLVGLILRGNFPAPRSVEWGSQPDEQGAKFLSENLEPGSYVLAGAPGAVWMARMEFQNVSSADAPLMDTSEDLIAWLHNRNIQAVYVDYYLAKDAGYHYGLIMEQMGKGLERVFMMGEGDVQIFFVNP